MKFNGSTCILACLILATCASLALGQAAIWTQRSDGGPSARYGHAMAYDSNRGVAVLFGGWSGATRYDDTWEWDGATWTQVHAGGSGAPSARWGHAMCFDSSINKVILHGGDDGSYLQDTWTWNGTAWTQVDPPPGPDQPASNTVVRPTGRREHAIVRDTSSSNVVLFGGYDGSNNLDDTWTLNSSTWLWTQKSPSTKPPVRRNFSMDYVSSGGDVAIFGGFGGPSSTYLDDAWIWNGSDWASVPATAKPPARCGHIGIHHPYLDTFIVWGGFGSGNYYRDCWVYIGDDSTWYQVGNSGPPERTQHAAVVDLNSGYLVIFGGYKPDPSVPDNNGIATINLRDTWEALTYYNINDHSNYNGSGGADFAVYRPENGRWYAQGALSGTKLGNNDDIPVPMDWNNDGSTDIAIWRPSNGRWYIGATKIKHGRDGDIPVPADYTGDGKTDLAVFRPSNGRWYMQSPASVVKHGRCGDIPVPADFNGDGSAQPAVWRPSNGKWYVYGQAPVKLGRVGDIPVPADYNGTAGAELAVWRPSSGKWYIQGLAALKHGQFGDVPVPGDYDGTGGAERAVWRRGNGRWYVYGQPSVKFGREGDIPLVRGKR